MIIGLHHVQLAMPKDGEDMARWFYRDLLGMTEIAKPANLAGRGGCWFSAGGAHIHLGVEDGFSPARKAHPALLVKDLAAVVVVLRAADVEIRPDAPLQGFARIYVSDPFGNRIELMQKIV